MLRMMTLYRAGLPWRSEMSRDPGKETGSGFLLWLGMRQTWGRGLSSLHFPQYKGESTQSLLFVCPDVGTGNKWRMMLKSCQIHFKKWSQTPALSLIYQQLSLLVCMMTEWKERHSFLWGIIKNKIIS